MHKAKMLELLREVEDLLETATCDGELVAGIEDVASELNTTLYNLQEAIDYYIE